MGKDPNKADILMGICYGAPSQDRDKDKIFYKQLRGVSQSLVSESHHLILIGDFNLPGSTRNIVTYIQSRMFLEHVEEKFLSGGLDWHI